MPLFHRSGLLGFLLLLAALVPHAARAKDLDLTSESAAAAGLISPDTRESLSSMEVRLRRIAAAVRQKQGLETGPEGARAGLGQAGKLAWVWGNGRGWGNGGGWRNGGWRNGGWRNGGWGNGWGNGWRNGGGVYIRW
ncbi:MAG: GrrA/OscA1 family cyclophane-containing rSAM-modified RiPP [Synechococcaceae cyanobacterium]|nr:GrrA/OscA1 family cyclophane-containing rSAM-modified RiPP [Synechococcaceae cyanobacterium]